MNQRRSLPQAPTSHERLRQIALELFSTHGYQSTSLRDLANHLGIHAGSIYNYIESKQSLLFELLEETLEELLAETRLSLQRGGNTHNQLRRFIHTLVVFQSREQQRLALLDRETINLSGEQQERIAALRAEYAQCLGLIIAPEKTGRWFADRTIRVLTNAIIGMLRSVPPPQEEEGTLSSLELEAQLTRMTIGAIMAAKN